VVRGQGSKSLIFGMFLAAPGLLVAQVAQNDTPLSTSEKAVTRFERLVNPLTFLYSAMGAGIGQWRDQPSEWGQGAGGFGRRFAASEGWKATQNSLGLGLDAAFHLDPRFHPTHETRFWPRLRGAALQTVVAYTDSGGREFNYSEVCGSYGASLIANSWFPPHSNGGGNAFVRGSIGLSLNTASNVVKEFWPDIRRKILRRER
jgi:hypothetical protein